MCVRAPPGLPCGADSQYALLPSYTFFRGVDIERRAFWDPDLANLAWPWTWRQLHERCAARGDCRSFNTEGYLKDNNDKSNFKWDKYGAPDQGLYIRGGRGP